MRRDASTIAALGLCVAGAWLTMATPLLAHGDPGRERVGWTDWSFDPVLWINLFLAAWLYARGLARLWQRVGNKRVVGGPQAAAFAGGMFVLVMALASPIDLLSEQLSWVHMVQHMLLMNLAAPLVVLGAPVYVWLWGLSPEGRSSFARLRRRLQVWHFPWYLLWQPLVLWAMYALALWLWHWPPLYQAALRQPLVHDLQHVSFFAASVLFWRVLLDPLSRWRLSAGPAVLYLFTTSLHATALGVFLTIAPTVWYADYEGRTVLWGMSALEDQQLAGLVMWMPACLAYVVVASILLLLWIERQDRKVNNLPAPMKRMRIVARQPEENVA